MNKQKKVILGIILLIVLFMGIGYAALTSVTLTINGDAKAVANQENFKVYFTGVSSVSINTVNVAVSEKSTSANINFNNFTSKDEEKHAILEIANDSTDIDAESVTVTVNSTEKDMFEVTTVMCDKDGNVVSDPNPVAAGGKTYVKVSTKLLQTPVNDEHAASITATITAVPKTN